MQAPNVAPARRRRLPQLRNACFTLNNPVDGDLEAILENPLPTYIIFGEEVGLDGTPHYQGYLEFGRPTAFRTVRRVLLSRAHIEKRYGTQAQAIKYCKKDGTFHEAGVPATQGRRSDLMQIMSQIRMGTSRRDLFECYPVQSCMYMKALDVYRSDCSTPWDSNIPRDVRYYHGASRTGKSRSARTEFPDISVHLGGVWFDGFKDGTAFLFDDLDDSVFKLSYLLQLLDRYPMRVQIKSSSVEWNAPVIIITSNLGLHEWYPNEPASKRNAFIQRFTTIRQF